MTEGQIPSGAAELDPPPSPQLKRLLESQSWRDPEVVEDRAFARMFERIRKGDRQLGDPEPGELGERSMDDVEGYALAERWEELAERFKPPSAAVITVTLTADEAHEVHDAMTAAVAALVAEIEAEKAAGRPPLG